MTIIWRGIGIIVPLAFVGFGALLSLWFDDRTLGNKSYVGWICLCTAILSLLVGLATLPGKKKDPVTGVSVPKKKHDFFYIPIIVWAFIFGGLAIWQLGSFKGFKSRADKLTFKDTEGMERWPTRSVNFYNPTPDTIRYVYVNTDLESDSWWIAPGDSMQVELAAGKYQFGTFDQTNKMRYDKAPTSAEAADKSIYSEWKDPGDGSTKILRIVQGATSDFNDYDDAWLLMDDSYSMLLVDITDLCNEEGDRNKAADETDWQDKIYNDYAGGDLIEPYIKGNIRDKMFNLAYVTVVLPKKPIPVNIHENGDVYLLVPYKTGNKPSNETIAKQIKEAGFEK